MAQHNRSWGPPLCASSKGASLKKKKENRLITLLLPNSHWSCEGDAGSLFAYFVTRAVFEAVVSRAKARKQASVLVVTSGMQCKQR